MKPKRILLLAVLLGVVAGGLVYALPDSRRSEWPNTDFSKTSIPLDEIFSGGPPKDGIPSIDEPQFQPVAEITDLPDQEPVIGLVVGGVAKAYPLRILIWHEIVNDSIGGVPVAVTFCPLCNAAVVFDRRLDGRVLDFGTTGMLRYSDLVMYDRQTESWWQQFLGRAIVGELNGSELKILPSRLESWANFRARAPRGLVLVPSSGSYRAYGNNPYAGYDSLARPFLYDGRMPEGIEPLARVVSLADRGQAWSLDLVRRDREIRLDGDMVIRWEAGQNSALDSRVIAEGADVGNIVVQQKTADGWTDVTYFIDFAFAFHAFYPEAPIHSP